MGEEKKEMAFGDSENDADGNDVDNEEEEEERIAEVDWQRLRSGAWKEGYREGVDQGTEEALQQGTGLALACPNH